MSDGKPVYIAILDSQEERALMIVPLTIRTTSVSGGSTFSTMALRTTTSQVVSTRGGERAVAGRAAAKGACSPHSSA
ncbi:MAG: hypothetical protein HPM95_21340 [Alphaproteobacteria bacterium]|nr:hypothetical protein [Alphaproteobacteria bacterium]MBL6432513.1 hypothetical protein [Alphaproteobacteria bacterium]